MGEVTLDELGARLLRMRHVVGYSVEGAKLVVYILRDTASLRRKVVEAVRSVRPDLVVEFKIVSTGFGVLG